jgi:hypothetical protein
MYYYRNFWWYLNVHEFERNGGGETVVWDVMTCNRVEAHWSFGGIYYLLFQDRKVSHASNQQKTDGNAIPLAYLSGPRFHREYGGHMFFRMFCWLSPAKALHPLPPKNRIIHIHRCENIRPYKATTKLHKRLEV